MYSYDATTVVLDALSRRKGEQSLKETLLAVRTFEGLELIQFSTTMVMSSDLIFPSA